MEGYKYIGTIHNQIAGYKDYTYLVEIYNMYGFFEITLNEEEEQAIIGAKLAFNLDTDKNLITKYRILEFIPMTEEKQTEEWQEGSKSNIPSLQRLDLHEEWLKKNQEDVKKAILNKKVSNENIKPIQGFVKDI